MSKIIAVTGSSGFVGKHLCKALRYNKNIVIEIDIEKGMDIEDASIFKSLTRYDYIIHLAAKSYVPDSYNDPISFYKTNFIGTLNVLESARNNNAKVIFLSSYLYGSPDYLPLDEHHKLKPHNPYAHSKILAEKLCEAYYRDFNIPTTVFRPFNIYGDDQNPNFLIPTILNQIQSGNVKLQDSKPKRDYIHVNDVVNAILLAISNKQHFCEKFNLGTGKSYSVSEIIEVIKKYTPTTFSVRYEEKTRKNEVLDCRADITKAKEFLNWEPQIDFQKGIKSLMEKILW
tara:strand:+ start:2200 stop:3057 length:858 start_codon:yes stop_codon:yes gene_type:complete